SLKNNLKIKELPINYYKRYGKSKLKSFADGWRHLRFMLLYCPLFLFLIPGLVLFLLGIASLLLLYFDLIALFGIRFQYHPMFLSAVLIIIGYQLVIFALFAKTYSITHLGDVPIFNNLHRYVTIEKASIMGILLAVLGIIVYLKIFMKWITIGFGELNEIKNAIVAMTLTALGMQTIFSSFMLSILGIKSK
ncbi:MAG: glycosyltransferase family 2 protein, partial [Candidatus Omnitrophica bacterium]|nr:glycosyltransferase family 2 protein [Candidatus Omnitrophota bacterium]